MKKKDKSFSLKTKRLQIKPLDLDGLTKRIENENDQHLKAAYSQMKELAEANPAGLNWYTLWDITLLESGQVVGSLGFKGAQINGEVEIGYGIDEPFRRKGYAAEAVKSVVDWAFGNEGVYFVTAETEQDNEASLKLLKKLGFKEYAMGEEGPRFEREKPKTSWMSIYMCLGLSVGLAIGNLSENMSTGMCIGMCLGLAIGSMMDSKIRNTVAELKKKRQDSTPSPDGE